MTGTQNNKSDKEGGNIPPLILRALSKLEYLLNYQFDLAIVIIFIIWFIPIILYPLLNLRIIHFLLSFTCHQDPSRSFYISSVPLPVCARCTGVYLGGLVSAILVYALDIKKSLPFRYFLLSLLIVFSEMLLEQFIEIEHYGNLIRALTGIFAGSSFILFFSPLTKKRIDIEKEIN